MMYVEEVRILYQMYLRGFIVLSRRRWPRADLFVVQHVGNVRDI